MQGWMKTDMGGINRFLIGMRIPEKPVRGFPDRGNTVHLQSSQISYSSGQRRKALAQFCL